MLVTLSLIGAVAGVTGAASITRWLSEALHVHSPKCQANRATAQCTDIAGTGSNEQHHSAALLIPQHLLPQSQLVKGLVDDVEIKLRSLRRHKPGPSRR